MADPSPNQDSTNRNLFLGDAPPLPSCSETDVYYASSPSPRSPLTLLDLHATGSGSSSGSSSGHGPTAPVDNPAFLMSPTSYTGSIIYTPPFTPRTEPNSNTLAPPGDTHARRHSAECYFEARPPPLPRFPFEIYHLIVVKEDSAPDDIPYPEDWALYEVTRQDWATFVNFLLPHHGSVKNEAIFGGKAKSEDDSDAWSAAASASDKPVGRTVGPTERYRRRREEVHSVVRQWNRDFFNPRSLDVIARYDEPEEPACVPEGSGTTSNNSLWRIPLAGPPQQREAMPQHRDGGFQGSWGDARGGFRENNGYIRWGDGFVSNGNGLRRVMDSSGIHMDEQGAANPLPFGREPGYGMGPIPRTWPPGFSQAGLDTDRGRALPHHDRGARPRSPSTSSSSSSDSSISSSSSESIGSLPDHDDIKDEQLPFYIDRLVRWIRKPHEVRTKADVKQLKAELKAGRANIITLGPDVDRKALRKQTKGIARQWRDLKRQQKKEEKQRRKHEKRNMKKMKKENKAAYKLHRKALRRRGSTGPPSVPELPTNVWEHFHPAPGWEHPYHADGWVRPYSAYGCGSYNPVEASGSPLGLGDWRQPSIFFG